MTFLRHTLVATAVIGAALVGCGSRSSGNRPASTELTAAELDSETGPCICRLPQDEGMTCCRSGLVMTCQCDGRWSCNTTPTGRACGSASRRPAGR